MNKKRKPRTPLPNIFEDFEEDDLTLADCFRADERTEKRRIRSSAANTVNEKTRSDFLRQFGAKPRGVFVPKWVLEIVTVPTDAIVFSQLIYWHSRSKPNGPWPERQLPYQWVAKSVPELQSELNLTKHQANHALQRLRNRGLIDWQTRKFGGVNHRHIWIDWRNVQLALEQIGNGNANQAHS